jgi:hypothetical protein
MYQTKQIPRGCQSMRRSSSLQRGLLDNLPFRRGYFPRLRYSHSTCATWLPSQSANGRGSEADLVESRATQDTPACGTQVRDLGSFPPVARHSESTLRDKTPPRGGIPGGPNSRRRKQGAILNASGRGEGAKLATVPTAEFWRLGLRQVGFHSVLAEHLSVTGVETAVAHRVSA